MGHVDIEVLQDLFVGVLEIFQQCLSKLKLEIKPILMPDLFPITSYKLLMVRNGQIDPAVLMGPSSHISKDL